MPNPRSIDPPTLLGAAQGLQRGSATLVRTYGTVPYRDIDPTIWAGITYVAMFGMMFGDVGHGLLLVAGAAMIRMGWIRRFPGLRPFWMFIAGAGAGRDGVRRVVWRVLRTHRRGARAVAGAPRMSLYG